jgi:hypothetical protein
VNLACEVVSRTRAGSRRRREYHADRELHAGDVIRLDGRDWLVDALEPAQDGGAVRVPAAPARYRLRLRHPD